MLSLSLVVGGAIAAILPPNTAAAACTTPSVNYGSATLQLSIPTQGTYRLWTRMQSPDAASNSVLLEVDGGSCYTVGGSVMPAKTWSWVNHQNGSTSSTITASLSAGTHTLKVVGVQPNIMIDRILAVADQACVPVNLGDNCMATADTTLPVVAITQPADNSTVNGVVALKATASDSGGVGRVEFYVQNQLISTDTSSPYEYNWDTSGLNGSYTVTAKAYDVTGNIGIDSRAYTVKNGDTQAPSSPVALTGNAAAYNSVKLKWGASSDATGVAGYRIVRDGVTIATTTATDYTDGSAVAGTKYGYYVVAFDTAGNVSGASNNVSVTTPNPTTVDAQAPTAPADVTVTAASKSQVNIAWKASADNIGVKEYDIYRATGTGTAVVITSTNTTSYGDGNLSANTAYRYYIIARDAAGNSSPASQVASITTPEASVDQGTGTIRGTVQGRNGRPVSGARVKIWVNGKRYHATTNWRGRYIIDNVPAGRYDVTVNAGGYSRNVQRVWIKADKTKWRDFTMRRNYYN